LVPDKVSYVLDELVDSVDTILVLSSVPSVIVLPSVIEFSFIDVAVLDKNVAVLVSVNNVGVTILMLVVPCGDDCMDEMKVGSTLRERTVDVTEFIVVSISTDEGICDDTVLLGRNIDVSSSFEVVVNNVDTLSKFSRVVNI